MAVKALADKAVEVHSIQVSHETYARMKSAGRMGDTFDGLISALLDVYYQARQQGVDLLERKDGE